MVNLSLAKYIIRRLLLLIPILLGTLLLTFILTHLMPGNPYLLLMGHPTPSAIAVYNANVDRLGLNKPIIIQFFMYMEALFQGQWGTSISLDSGGNVWTIIWTAFPHTLELALYSEILAVIIGIRVGVISAVNRNKPKDTTIRIIALVGVSVPVFFLGTFVSILFWLCVRNFTSWRL